MRLIRSHVGLPLAPATTVTLPEAAANHLTRVLRLCEGDDCVLFNGDGHDYPARIHSVSKREVTAQVLTRQDVDRESPLQISLLQGIARGEKMDLILQKATELGVVRVLPVIAERTEVKLDAERSQKRMLHWRNVIVSACEQSGRAILPELVAPQPLLQAANRVTEDLRLTLDPKGEQRLSQLNAPGNHALTIAIGPEGGWSPRDREILTQAGFIGVQLGPRILRTETAGLATIAALQARFGDL